MWYDIIVIGLVIISIAGTVFAFYMERRDNKRWIEKHGRKPNADDYLDHGMWP
jgi:hypothetical protein